jgi:hypothetical protein
MAEAAIVAELRGHPLMVLVAAEHRADAGHR